MHVGRSSIISSSRVNCWSEEGRCKLKASGIHVGKRLLPPCSPSPPAHMHLLYSMTLLLPTFICSIQLFSQSS